MARPTQEQRSLDFSPLSLEALRERWRALYGNPAPSLRRGLLIRAVAHQLQVKAFGGLSAATKKKLREIAVAAREGRFDPAVIGPRVKPGTRLIRVWQGETHSVLVLLSCWTALTLRPCCGTLPRNKSERSQMSRS